MPSSPPRICDLGAAAPTDIRAARARELGFNYVAVDEMAEPVSASLPRIVNMSLSELPTDNEFVSAHPNWFSFREMDAPDGIVDPRNPCILEGRVVARYYEAADAFDALWLDILSRYLNNGVAGFRLCSVDAMPADALSRLIAAARKVSPQAIFIADVAGLARERVVALAGCGFDFCLSSLAWWDFAQSWLVEEYDAISRVGAVLSRVDADRGLSPASCREREARLSIAAAAGSGLWVPLRFADSESSPRLDRSLQKINNFVASDPILAERGSLVQRGHVLLRTNTPDIRTAREAIVAVITSSPSSEPHGPVVEDWQLSPLDDACDDNAYEHQDVRIFRAARRSPIVLASRKLKADAPRIVITNIMPAVDDGKFAVKRIVGDTLEIEADIFADGHMMLAADLIHNGVRSPMRLVSNDRWQAHLTLERLGRHEFFIEAWEDRYGGFARDLAKKQDAGRDVQLDLQEGEKMLAKSLGISSRHASVLLAPETIEAMRRSEERRFLTRSATYPVDADRRAATFANWYELFPRSQTHSVSRHGTFADVIPRLPDIREMGFDVLYLPPIHPIGQTNRKGRDNALTAEPGDPGSVYAIGSAAGGHDAIHPELGTFADFRALIAAARSYSIEIALDFAVQCSPDHPWLKDHPGWFDWRVDGSIKFAENPPKTYEDIVNVDFYAKDAVPGLWRALRDIVRIWAKEGVRIFRVDNPHTKPFPFWQWLIASIHATDPEIIFLAEAFTRPKVMNHLAKIGFTQSYTYFTWRNTKDELTQYLTELNGPPVRDFFRPHFFVNTPDINPYFLQSSGRPGFLIRAALAATLSGLWGIYSGYELCESAPLPGREEYLDSEKYAIKPRDWHAPGNIRSEIATLNRLRKSHLALQSHLGVTFYNASNRNILYYGKQASGETSRILVAVSLNPHGTEACDFEIPLWEWGLPDSGALLVEDLLSGGQFVWRGKIQQLYLTPEAPYRIFRAFPAENQQ